MGLKKINLPFRVKRPILALGSQKKNTLCFAKNNQAYLSHVHPDLSEPGGFFVFERAAKHFLKKNPKIIACDLHPEYQSTKYAHNLTPNTYNLIPIQHHHAHIASCMAENGLANQKVIGVAFDGTGLGPDASLWGAEFLICDYRGFKRAGHLKEIPLLGAEKAILEPWRLAAAWLYLIYGDRFLDLKVNFIKRLDKQKWQVLKKMYAKGFNAPLASSMGRLFDAAASLILGKNKAVFEAELAIELEKAAQNYRAQGAGYQFKISKESGVYVIDPEKLFKEIISDLRNNLPKEKIAYRFHLSVAAMVKQACLILRKENKINKLVLSGGVFQNKLLASLIPGLLSAEGFIVFTHKNYPPGDSNISLGQAAIAAFSKKGLTCA